MNRHMDVPFVDDAQAPARRRTYTRSTDGGAIDPTGLRDVAWPHIDVYSVRHGLFAVSADALQPAVIATCPTHIFVKSVKNEF